MRHMISKVALAAAIFSGVFNSASAAVQNLDLIGDTTAFHSTTVLGNFDDFYTFSIAPEDKLAAFLTSTVSFNETSGAKGLDIRLYNGTLTSVDGTTPPPISSASTVGTVLDGPSIHTTVVSTANLMAGASYTLRVNGVSFTPSAYVGLITLTDLPPDSPMPAVPEPETYAMLVAGLGMMGFIARRRQKRS